MGKFVRNFVRREGSGLENEIDHEIMIFHLVEDESNSRSKSFLLMNLRYRKVQSFTSKKNFRFSQKKITRTFL